MAGLLGWRVIKKGAVTERRRGGGGQREETSYRARLQLLESLQLRLLWNPAFHTISWETPVSLQKDSLIVSVSSLLYRWPFCLRCPPPPVRHRSRWAVQRLLVPLFGCTARQYSCLVFLVCPSKSKLVWSFYFDKVKESNDRLLRAGRRVAARSADCAELWVLGVWDETSNLPELELVVFCLDFTRVCFWELDFRSTFKRCFELTRAFPSSRAGEMISF